TNVRLGPLEHRRQADVQRAQAGDQAGGTAADQLFTGGDLGEQVTLVTTAQMLGEADAKDAGVTRLLVQLTGKLFSFLPLIDKGQDFPLDETPNGITNHLVRLIEIGLKGGHAGTPVIVFATLT